MLGLSVCRNPKLAAIFYRLELIEAYGTGIPKIMRAYAGTGLEPKIEVTQNAFKITLPNLNRISSTEVNTSNPSLTTEDCVLNLIISSGYVVRSDIEKSFNVSQATASRILKRMVEDGLIKQVGSGKNTKYIKA